MPGNTEERLRQNLALLVEKSEEFRTKGHLPYWSRGLITTEIRESLMTYILDLILPNFHFLTSTKLLACSYADKFLSLKPIAQLSALELIGITALSLASKFNEGKNLTPAVVFQILDSKFSIDSIVKMETFFLLTLD